MCGRSEQRVHRVDFRTAGAVAEITEITDDLVLADAFEYEIRPRIETVPCALIIARRIETHGDGADADHGLGWNAQAPPQAAVLAGEFQVVFSRFLVTIANAVLGAAQFDDSGEIIGHGTTPDETVAAQVGQTTRAGEIGPQAIQHGCGVILRVGPG